MKLEWLRAWPRVLALGLTMVVAASSNVALADDWILQVWGERPPQAALLPNDQCAGDKGERGLRFDRSAGNGAEVVYRKQALEPGQAYEAVLRLKAAPDSAPDVWVDVALRKDGPYYETSMIQSVRLTGAAWQEVVIRGHYTSIARGSLRLGLRSGAGAICIGATELRPIATQSSPDWRVVSDAFMGIHLNKLGRHNAWPSFQPDVLRMWSTATTWAELQPKAGPIDWRDNIHAQRLDYFVQHVRRQAGAPQMIMTLGMTPTWAADPAVDGQACLKSPWGVGSCQPPKDLALWRNHVRHLAERYRDSPIRVWELWNEADVSTHWVGGADRMVQLAKVAREELRQVSADNVLIGPNVTSMGIRFLHDFLQAGGARYIDGISVHVYMGRDAERAHAMLENVKSLMRAHAIQLPIWNTETNTACGGGPLADRLLEQAACRTPAVDVLAQSVLLHAAQGIENLTFYTWEGAELDVGGVGLVQEDFRTVTPAGKLMARLRALLQRGTRIRLLDAVDARLRQVAMQTNGVSCVAYWAKTNEVIQFVPPPKSRIRQLDGVDVRPAVDGSVLVSTMPQVACTGALPW